MAYRHILTKQGTLLRRWSHPSLSHIALFSHCDNDSGNNLEDSSCQTQTRMSISDVVQSHFHHNGGFGALSGRNSCLSGFCLPAGVGFSTSLSRYMSSATSEGSNNVDYVAGILTEKTVELVSTQEPVVTEIIYVYPSFPPAAAIQYLIETVHVLTGLNWWLAIAIATILIKGAAMISHINLLQNITKINLTNLKKIIDKSETSVNTAINLLHDHEGLKKGNHLFELYVVPLLVHIMVESSIFFSFLFAISNMNETVPSLKAGGAFWFTNLTTPDTLYVFPVLASLLTLMYIEAFFCYWISSTLCDLSYAYVVMLPGVKKFLVIATDEDTLSFVKDRGMPWKLKQKK